MASRKVITKHIHETTTTRRRPTSENPPVAYDNQSVRTQSSHSRMAPRPQSGNRSQSTSIQQPFSSEQEDPFSNISSIRMNDNFPSREPSSRLQLPSSSRLTQNTSRLRAPSSTQPRSINPMRVPSSSSGVRLTPHTNIRVPSLRPPQPVASSTLRSQGPSGRASQSMIGRTLQPVASSTLRPPGPSGRASQAMVGSSASRNVSGRMPQPIASSTLLPQGPGGRASQTMIGSRSGPNQSARNVAGGSERPNVRSATITKKTAGGGKTTEEKKTVTRTTMPRSAGAGPSRGPGEASRLKLSFAGSQPNVYVPPGHYAIPTKRGATVTQGGRPVVLSSPQDLRRMLDQKAPLAVQTFSNMPDRGTYRDPGQLRAHPAYQDMQAGMIDIHSRQPLQYGPLTREEDYFAQVDNSQLDSNVDPFADFDMDDEDDFFMEGSLTSLEEMLESRLQESAMEHTDSKLEVSGIHTQQTAPPIIMTDHGPVQGTHQVNVQQTIKRLPEMELVNRHTTSVEADGAGGAHEIEMDVQQFIPEGLNMTRLGETDVPLKEVISVTSSITIAPGVTSKSTKTTYERLVRTEPEDLDEDQVEQLVNAENEDVNLMNIVTPLDLKGSAAELYDLKKKVQKSKLNPKHVRDLEQSVAHPKAPQSESAEDLHPELMAALMHSQEMGLGLGSEPANVCNYLFPESKEPAEAASAAPRRSPKGAPAAETVVEVSSEAPKDYPTGDVYTASLLRQQTRPLVPKPQVRSPPPQYPVYLEEEEPPWQDGEQSSTDAPDKTLPPEEETRDEMEFLEYELVPQPPKHMSRIQLRGSQMPPWFPGYYMALPNKIKMAKSLTEVLPAAWKAVQPNIFDEDSFVVVG